MAYNMYISEAIKQDMKQLQEAFVSGELSVHDIHKMVHSTLNGHHDRNHEEKESEKEERVSPHTPFPKEESEKEERDATTATANKKSKKNVFSEDNGPLMEEVQAYHKKLKINTFTAGEFYDYYESFDWKTKEGNRVKNWKALMRSWKRKGERDNESVGDCDGASGNGKTGFCDGASGHGKAGFHDGASGNRHGKQGYTAEADKKKAIVDYLDEHYAVADTAVEAVVGRGMDRNATLRQMANEVGTGAVFRVVIKQLYMLGKAMSASKKTLQPENLDTVAKALLPIAVDHTMQDLQCFFNRCQDGDYGRFLGGLTTMNMVPAFKKWRMNK